jgi:hypothetical protein
MVAAEHLRNLVASFQDLLEGHIRLFKIELAEDARVVGIQVAKIAAFVPLILTGYGFVCAATALFLRRFLPFDVSLLIVGLVNLAVGAGGIALAALKLRGRQVLLGSTQELLTSRAVLMETAGLKPEHHRG